MTGLIRKVGILTRYYGSENYGGVLQAYALNRYIRELGFDCETLQYDSSQKVDEGSASKRVLFKRGLSVRKIIQYAAFTGKKILYRPLQKKLKQTLRRRSEKFATFRRDDIPHSKSVFHAGNIADANQSYDAFIVGSDRVWMPNGYRIATEKPFFLDFVLPGKKKIAYAASMGKQALKNDENTYYQHFLNGFDAVGLREQAARELLNPLIGADHPKAELVVDPVFLIDPEGWEPLLTPARQEAPYAFVYLLDTTRHHRKLIRRFAKARGLQLVTLPFAGGAFNINDLAFGDVMAYDCGPREFVGYIKGATSVLTDSFHCAVFSLIFKKEFFVFDRDQATRKKSYLDRITSLMEMAGIKQDRIIRKETGIEQFLKIAPIAYEPVDERLQESILRSKSFLQQALSDHPKMKANNEI